MQSVLFLIYEQKYLELLEQGRAMEALECLRRELTPLHQDFVRVHRLSRLALFFTTVSSWTRLVGISTSGLTALSLPLPMCSLMMLTDANELKQRANWDGVRGSSRSKLLEKLRSMATPLLRLVGRRCNLHNVVLACAQDIFPQARFFRPEGSRHWFFKRWSSRSRIVCSTTRRTNRCPS